MAFVLTDGRSNDFGATLRAAEKLHMANIEVYAVAIGESVDDDELSAIATTAENVLSTDFSIAQLRELQEFLDRQACEGMKCVPDTLCSYIRTFKSYMAILEQFIILFSSALLAIHVILNSYSSAL